MNKSLKNNERKYTQIQYFFWLFSGAEINILEECPTDYNRQAGIGFTIFMTTLFAMFAGGYAGWYFSKSNVTALIFAIIWGMLIFSIDRTLVVTLKKDPDNPKQNFWAQFLGRAVLAGLIAFIISIPLELLIFRDKIDEQKMIDKENTILEYRNLMGDSKGINSDKAIENLATNSSERARENASDCNTDNAYVNLETQRRDLEPQWKTKKNIRDAVINKYNNLRRNFPPSTAFAYKRSATYQNAISNFRTVDADYQTILSEKSKRCAEYILEQNKIASEQGSIASEFSKIVLIKSKTADTMAKKLDSLQQESFIRDYIALENAAKRKITYISDSTQVNNGTTEAPDYKIKYYKRTKYANEGMLFFLWLVRILFFVIEILPTLAKIVTPAGAYDRAIKKTEDDYALELEERTADYLIKQKEIRDIKHRDEISQLNDKGGIERKLQKEILEKAAEAQNAVALNKIEEFKRINLINPTTSNTTPPVHLSKFPDRFWKQKNVLENIEYFFRNGQSQNNELIYSIAGNVTKGVWNYNHTKTEISIEIANNKTDFEITEMTSNYLKLSYKGKNDFIEFESH